MTGNCHVRFGATQDIERELTQVFAMAANYLRFIFCTGNYFPTNIPLGNAIYYVELVEELSKR